MRGKQKLDIHIVTLFPGMFTSPFEESIIQRARKKGLVRIEIHNLRRYAQDKHKTCDDKPFGGGPGMVMKPDPIFACMEDLKKKARKARVILLSPQGRIFNQKEAWRLSRLGHLIFLCGHYEGVDERVRELLVDEEFSIGDFVTTGGELPCLAMVDSIVRLVPGVVGNEQSIYSESFQDNLLEFPQYTRPAIFRGHKVPEVLLSGDHEEVARWRREQATRRTRELRPDLLEVRNTKDEKPRHRNHRKAFSKKGSPSF